MIEATPSDATSGADQTSLSLLANQRICGKGSRGRRTKKCSPLSRAVSLKTTQAVHTLGACADATHARRRYRSFDITPALPRVQGCRGRKWKVVSLKEFYEKA
ncbi:hypothetical protein TGPRC2_311850 [Toxoplasma gondii TgCatPRC2]|uniref:Uncharacterized protein n=12 Tax=Toxoplasma gondii TaxID=5811 RepID=A0A125YVY4_TOXGV|nr:hypothetical protein TGME49_311850 [Toxoplasma gondii ME49]EPR61072.1 hypothetical protein TGGT1_311850 [Toxoplasma gondii GT1]ESS34981.1 hypothetical protein TGVEG_311850 [Toxoplasma gondii VEG]KFG28652.1 hypothetical protein TGP89_311850 [Toxoplasma gondii p89]KFG44286.1 hypothetical protein TGDOM2_311850 [Toxoplasma gondii GAB2-2007-GAL-DOM2]KFG55950.1 hypothetical protein TGFOU_311850 [Toxoplasma gondii FOU]KFH09535.1 hypothetical protein TGVAND_311850 [Toxoplasma gondii VAND]KFH17954|eukprot:XP_002364418.1 hypothetical protein TGME49_311850 [Toxoplasma gondii ME49]